MKIPKHRFAQQHYHFFCMHKITDEGILCLLACVCDAINEISTTVCWVLFLPCKCASWNIWNAIKFKFSVDGPTLVKTIPKHIEISNHSNYYCYHEITCDTFVKLKFWCYANVCQNHPILKARHRQKQTNKSKKQHAHKRVRNLTVCVRTFKFFTGKNHNIFGAILVKMAISISPCFECIEYVCVSQFFCRISQKLLIVCIDFFIIHERRKQTYFTVLFAFFHLSLFFFFFSFLLFPFRFPLPTHTQFAKKHTAQNHIDIILVYGQARNGLVVRR